MERRSGGPLGGGRGDDSAPLRGDRLGRAGPGGSGASARVPALPGAPTPRGGILDAGSRRSPGPARLGRLAWKAARARRPHEPPHARGRSVPPLVPVLPGEEGAEPRGPSPEVPVAPEGDVGPRSRLGGAGSRDPQGCRAPRPETLR